MKLYGLFLLCSVLFFGSVSAKAEVPMSRVTRVVRTTSVTTGTHYQGVAPVYPYPYPQPYPYYRGYSGFSSFSFNLSFGFGGFGRPFFMGGCRSRRCARPVSRCRMFRRRCF